MYDIKRFMKEDLGVSFDNKKEYHDFIECCMAEPECKVYGSWDIWYKDKVLVYGFSFSRLQRGSDGYIAKHWRLIKAKELLLYPLISKNDLMDFLTL